MELNVHCNVAQAATRPSWKLGALGDREDAGVSRVPTLAIACHHQWQADSTASSGRRLCFGTPLDGSGDIKALSVFSIDQQFTVLIISEHV